MARIRTCGRGAGGRDGTEPDDLDGASLLQDRATTCQPGRFFEVRAADDRESAAREDRACFTDDATVAEDGVSE